jgi:hypothetical protein
LFVVYAGFCTLEAVRRNPRESHPSTFWWGTGRQKGDIQNIPPCEVHHAKSLVAKYSGCLLSTSDSMIWNVEGADAHTGAERLVSVVADSESEAEQLASAQGLLVSAVFPSTIAEAKPFDASKVAAAAAVAEPVNAASPGVVPTVAYRSLYTKSPTRLRKPWSFPFRWPVWRWTWDRPAYFHLRVATLLLAGLAGLSYVSGLIAVLIGVINFFRRLDLFGNFLGALYDLFTLVSPLILGALLHAAAAACDALRDITLAAQRAASAAVNERSLREEQRDREVAKEISGG